MASAKKTIRSVIWSGIEAGGMAGLQFVTLIVMARLLAPSDFGLAALAYSVIALLGLLTTGLFADAIVQRRDLNRAHLDSAFWTSLALSALVVAGCLASAPYWAVIFDEPAVAPVLAWMSISLLAQGASGVHVSKFRRDLNFKAIAIRRLVGFLFGATVGIAMAFNGYGVWSLVGQRLVTSTVSAILVWVSSPYRPGAAFSRTALWELLRFGLPSLGGQIVHVGRQRLLQLLIGYFLGVTALGYVDLAFRITFNIRRLVSATLSSVTLPILSRRQDDREHLKRGAVRATGFTCLAIQPFFAGLGICAEEAVLLMVGAEWLPAVPLVQILCAVVMVESARQIYGTALVALGKPQISLMVMTIGLTVSVSSILVFGREDMVAAILAWHCQYIVTWPIHFYFVQRIVGLKAKEQVAAFAGPLAAAVLMALAVYGVKTGMVSHLDAISTLLVIVPFGALAYGGLIMLLRPKLIPDFFRFLTTAFRRGGSVAAE